MNSEDSLSMHIFPIHTHLKHSHEYMCIGTPENTCCFFIFQSLLGRKQIRRLQLTVSLSIPWQVNWEHPMCSSDWGSPNQKLIPQISDLDGMKLKFRNSYLSFMLLTVEAKVQEWWFKELLLQVNHGNDCKKNRVTNMIKVKTCNKWSK